MSKIGTSKQKNDQLSMHADMKDAHQNNRGNY
jgi:hypothetical protein